MKKTISTLLFAICSLVVAAQGFHVGPRVGFTMSNMITKDAFGTEETESIPGFQIGATAEFEVLSFLYVGTTLSLYQKGVKNILVPGVVTARDRFSYIDLPIEVGFKMPIGVVSVYGQVGPYVSIAIAGKSHLVDHNMPEYNETYSLYEYDQYKRFDSGLSLAVGADYKQYQIRVNYAFGFIDMDSYDTYTAVNSSFNISAAYFLGRDY